VLQPRRVPDGETGVKRDLATAKAEFVIIEGATGVFTGASSTARIADIIGAPMILTVDASASSESVAATVLGFMQYASHTPYELRIVGVVATRVGSDSTSKTYERLSRESGFPCGCPSKGRLGAQPSSKPALWTRTRSYRC
jgi:cobyrinic acid a,c-diamide synthase